MWLFEDKSDKDLKAGNVDTGLGILIHYIAVQSRKIH